MLFRTKDQKEVIAILKMKIDLPKNMISSNLEKIMSFYCLHIPLDALEILEWDSA